MFEKIVSVIILMLVVGCTTVSHEQTTLRNSDATLFKTDFNQETYIWESWLFPSNKTTGK